MHRPLAFHRPGCRWACSQVLLCSLLAVTLVGCQIPDLTGFSASAITVRSSLGQAESIYRPFVRQYGPSKLQQFDQDWEKIELATDALVEYAQSLEAIAAAGKKGAEGAKQLAESVKRLAGRFNAAGLAVSVGGDILAEAYGLVATGIAAHTLAETTKNAQPLIDKICRILAVKVADNLADDIPTIYEKIKSDIDEDYPDVAGAAQYERLVKERSGLLSNLSGKKPQDWAEDVVKNLDKLDAVIARLQPRQDAWQQEIKDAELLRDRQERLLKQLGVTVRAFAAEHRSIRATLEANRAFTLTNVQHAAGELAKLIERIEEIRDNG